MLKKETIAVLAALAKLTPDQLTTAISAAEEVDLTIEPTLKAYTDAEIGTLGNNKYNDGKVAGVEMDVKKARETHGLEFTGKSIDNLLAAYAEKVKKEAGLPKDQQLTELNNQITQLKTVNADLTTKLTQKDDQLTGVTIDSQVISDMPGIKDGVLMSSSDVLGLMKMKGYSFKKDTADGPIKPYLNGQLITDPLGSAKLVKDVTTEFMTTTKLIGTEEVVPIGRGGGGVPVVTGTAKTMSELKAQYTAAGKHLAGQEFMAAAEKAMKDPNFDANK